MHGGEEREGKMEALGGEGSQGIEGHNEELDLSSVDNTVSCHQWLGFTSPL